MQWLIETKLSTDLPSMVGIIVFSDICSMEFQTADLYLIKTWDGSYKVSEIILK